MTDKAPNALINIDLGDLSGAAKTLIEKVSGAFGGFFAPWQIRRVAKARADADIIEAQAAIQVTDLHRRAAQRWFNEEAQRQKNIEDITIQAIPHLNENTNANNIDDDWITNFFDKARIITDADMQKLWSRLLAEEANKPGSHSKRSVNILGDMDKKDAELFTNLCRFCCLFGDIVPLIFDSEGEIYLKHNINFNNLMHLDSIGLIQFSSLADFRKVGLPKRFSIYYYGEPVYLTTPKDNNNELNIGKVILTKVGGELAQICGSQPIAGFREYIKAQWQAFSPSDFA